MSHLKFRYMSNTTKEVISPNEVADCPNSMRNKKEKIINFYLILRMKHDFD